MSVAYILNQCGNKMGLDPSVDNQRSTLLRFLNEAAVELYVQSDMSGSLVEQVFKVNGNQDIALPDYVGQLRAIREFNSQIPWHINQLRPRYNVANWKDMWRNWRIKGQGPAKRSIRNQAELIVTVAAVESPAIVVTLSGPTDTASSVSETLTMDAVSKSTVNNFLDLSAATKNRVNQYDVLVSDVDDLEITTIPNNRINASYLIIDVSTLPWSNQDVDQQAHYVEVLYKQSLPWFKEDGQEFLNGKYDNVLVNKMMQLWAEEQGKGELAVAYDNKATRSLARIHEEENRATEDQVAFVTNGYDELLTRLRTNRPGRFGASIYPYAIS